MGGVIIQKTRGPRVNNTIPSTIGTAALRLVRRPTASLTAALLLVISSANARTLGATDPNHGLAPDSMAVAGRAVPPVGIDRKVRETDLAVSVFVCHPFLGLGADRLGAAGVASGTPTNWTQVMPQAPARPQAVTIVAVRPRAGRGAAQSWFRHHIERPPATDSCVPWPYARTPRGYGLIRIDGRAVYVTRVIAGASATQVVRHTCDNAVCVNPRHLVMGSQADNVQDCIERGRHRPPVTARGEAHHAAKLRAQDVRDIRASAEPAAVLARRYCVRRALIHRVRRRETWRHI